MQISLQAKDRKFLRRQIEAGRYDSEREVLLAGLRTLEALEAVDEERKARCGARKSRWFIVDPKKLPQNTPVLLKIVDDWLAKRRVPRRKRARQSR